MCLSHGTLYPDHYWMSSARLTYESTDFGKRQYTTLPLFMAICQVGHRERGCITHGVRFLVLPPVGPAVPLSQTQYVAPSVPLTFSAKPFTTSSVGPLYDFT